MHRSVPAGALKRLRFRTVRYTVLTGRLPRGAALTVALVSDLHGNRADDLATVIGAEGVDLIAVAGDLIEGEASPMQLDALRREEGARMKPFARFVHRTLRRLDGCRSSPLQDNGHIFALLSALSAIAPTVYAPGNHERNLSAETLDAVRQSGVRYLSDDSTAIATPCGMIYVGGTAAIPALSAVEHLAMEDGVRILLCHRPELYDDIPAMRRMDLVLSGHTHGGQIRLLGKGLFAPGQGFFPRYAGGVYHGNLVVGRGLANTTFLPRLGNPRELPVITLAGI